MKILLGCIADDFTGATDLAGIISRANVPVSLRLGVPDAMSAGSDTVAPFEIIALKCRTSPKAEAVDETLNALKWLQANGARQVYWKYCSTFDSTAEGNIGPVAEALLENIVTSTETTPMQTIYCPAFPDNARSIYMSNLYVGEQPLHESPMKDHPLTPMRDSNLVRLLSPQVKHNVDAITWPTVRQGHASIRQKLDELHAAGVVHVVVDAVDADDLLQITRATEHLPLLTGGSALALHLPQLYREKHWLDADNEIVQFPKTTHANLVLSGSCSAMTQKQVAHLAATWPSFRLDPLKLAHEQQLDEVQQWLGKQSLEVGAMIYATAAPDVVSAAQRALGRKEAGEIVENALAKLAVDGFNHGARRIIVAGGETSGAVVKALNFRHLRIGHEIAPGVPWTFAPYQGETIALALKSGNFGGEHFFTDAFSSLNP